jgi:hypothetical protein
VESVVEVADCLDASYGIPYALDVSLVVRLLQATPGGRRRLLPLYVGVLAIGTAAAYYWAQAVNGNSIRTSGRCTPVP